MIDDNYAPQSTSCNGTTTVFTGSWTPIAASYFKLELELISTGVRTAQTQGVDYTLAFTDAGYTATMTTAPSALYNVIRYREVAVEQDVAYKTSSGFQGAVIENSFDLVTAAIQDVNDAVSRSIKFPIGSPTSDVTIAEPEAGKVLIWNNDEDALINGDLADASLVQVTPSITSNLTINVPADYATPLAAMNYLMDYFISPDVTVTISVASGSYTHAAPLPAHPQGSQITISGATLTFPVASDFVITGSDSGARATDNAAHLVMLKAKFATEIYCNNCMAIDSTDGYTVPTLRNLLFWTDNTSSLGVQIYHSLTYWNNVSFHGWGGIGIALVNCGHIRADGLTISGMGDDAVQFSDAAELKSIGTFISASNAISGAFGKRGGIAEIAGAVCKGNGGDGLLVQDDAICEAPNAVLTGNAANGGATGLGGVLNVVSATISSNGDYGLLAENAGLIIATSAVVSSNGDGGFLAEGVGKIVAGSSQSNDNTGAGYLARELGEIFCENSSADGNTSHNYFAQNGGRVSASNSDSVDAGSSGFRSEGLGSLIDCRSGSATTSAANGLYSVFGGVINATSFSTTNNTGAGVRVDEGSRAGHVHFQSGTCTGNGSRGLYVVNGGSIDAENATINTNTGNEAQVDNAGNIRVTGTGLVSGDTNLTIDTPAGTGSQALIWE